MFLLQACPGRGTPEAATQSPSPRSLRRGTQRAPGRPGAECPWTASCPPSSPPPPRGRPPPPAPRADSREGGAEAAPPSGGGGRSTCSRKSFKRRSTRRFIITEKAPTRAFSWLKVATTAFTFKTLLRHYAKRALTPRQVDMKLGRRRTSHKGRAGWLA